MLTRLVFFSLLDVVVGFKSLECHLGDHRYLVVGGIKSPSSCSCSSDDDWVDAGVTDGQVEGCEEGVDEAELGAGEGRQKADLEVEEHAKKGSEELSDDDGSKDSQEERKELQNLVQVKFSLVIAGIRRCTWLVNGGAVVRSRGSIACRWGSIASRGLFIALGGSRIPLVSHHRPNKGNSNKQITSHN